MVATWCVEEQSPRTQRFLLQRKEPIKANTLFWSYALYMATIDPLNHDAVFLGDTDLRGPCWVSVPDPSRVAKSDSE